MTVKIITGTLFDITDPKGELRMLYENGAFLKQIWNGKEWLAYDSGIISWQLRGEKINVVQETGAGKTILMAVFTFKSHKKGRKIGGNLRFEWSENNIGKNKKDWKPAIRCMKDIENAQNIDICLDDLYGTITAWNCEEADMIRTVTLRARKEWINIFITCQFLTNQVPPDLRRVTGEFHIPFIRCFDGTRKSPDGHNYPLEIIDLIFNSHLQFKGYKVYDLQSETGQEILNGFDTLEVSTSLVAEGNVEDEDRTNQSGYQTEKEAHEWLKEKYPDKKWELLNGKKVFDILGENIALDVVGTNDNGNLYCRHKNMNDHMRTGKKLLKTPYLMYKFKDTWKFVKINSNLVQRTKGEEIDTYHMNTKNIEDII